jgi:hypothetical protein
MSSPSEHYRVGKRAVPVRVRLNSGRQISAVVQCAEQSDKHLGRERVKDVLNAEEPLVPLWNETTQANTLVNKAFIELVELEEPDLSRPDDPDLTDRRPVTILLASGTSVRGNLIISTPPGQDRTLDFLNRGERFFYLETEQAHCIVHLAHVVTVSDLDARINPAH